MVFPDTVVKSLKARTYLMTQMARVTTASTCATKQSLSSSDSDSREF